MLRTVLTATLNARNKTTLMHSTQHLLSVRCAQCLNYNSQGLQQSITISFLYSRKAQ